MTLFLRQVWGSALFPHALLAAVAVGAFHAQSTYRVPSLLGVMALPIVGVTLLVLSVVILVTRLGDRAAGGSGLGHRALLRLIVLVALPLAAGSLLVPAGLADRALRTLLVSGSIAIAYLTVVSGIARLAAPTLAGGFGRALRGVEYALLMVVGGFALYGLVCYVNGALDRSPTADVRSQVLQIGRPEALFYEGLPYAWSDFASWRNGGGGTERMLLTAGERRALWPGEGVIMEMRSGALGIPWVARVRRDEEWQYRRVLEIAPTAAGARKALINLYISQTRWPEAAAAALEYQHHYPKDFEYLRGVASTLMFVGQDTAAVALVEPFARNSARPAALTMAGWALHRAARKTGLRPPAASHPGGDSEATTRGIAMLETSSRMDPGNLWTFYYLGYAYRDVGRLNDALAAFQRVVDKVPAHSDARRQMADLREQLAAQNPATREENQPPASRRSSIKIR
jgi:tetratricopeptide (TPR) repeat protein